MQQMDYKSGNEVFLHDPCQDVITKGQSYLRVSSVHKSVKRGFERVKVENLHC
jgi:hypothetical protein